MNYYYNELENAIYQHYGGLYASDVQGLEIYLNQSL